MEIKKILMQLEEIQNPLARKVRFLGLLSAEMRRRGAAEPLIVGGQAVEIYTQGGYATDDIDLKGRASVLSAILDEMGFSLVGTHYAHPSLDIHIQWLGEGPDTRFEAPDKIVEVSAGGDLYIRVVGYEDLIIDRLCAAKFWRDSDSLMWAKIVFDAMSKLPETPPNLDYLRNRAEEEDVADLLTQVENQPSDGPVDGAPK